MRKLIQVSLIFRKFTLHHFAFTEEYLFLLTERNLKRIFAFTKKRLKIKIEFSVRFAESYHGGSAYYKQ